MASGNNYELVEGDFKTFEFRRILEEDVEAVLQHIQQNFVLDEVTCKTLGVTQDFLQQFMEVCRVVINFKMSFWAKDKSNGEVAGVRLIFRFKQDVNPFSHLTLEAHQLKTLLYLMGSLNVIGNFFEKYGINEYAELFLASTGRNYRNQGLTKEFYRRSLAYLKAEGYKLAKVFVTSPWTKAATKSLNFEQFGELEYETVKNEDGELIFNPKEVQGLSIAGKIFILN